MEVLVGIGFGGALAFAAVALWLAVTRGNMQARIVELTALEAIAQGEADEAVAQAVAKDAAVVDLRKRLATAFADLRAAGAPGAAAAYARGLHEDQDRDDPGSGGVQPAPQTGSAATRLKPLP
jgi:hypothetical protein